MIQNNLKYDQNLYVHRINFIFGGNNGYVPNRL